jgi:starvation-inducible DNA-binding protein
MTETMKKARYKKLGFTSIETVEIVSAMNKLLANYHVHYQKMRNFHWNVKGKDFFELHDKFEEIYLLANENIDEVAERVRVFGQTPLSKLEQYLDIAQIKEVGSNLHAEAMVFETIQDFQVLLSFMIDVSDAAARIGDVGTEDMINDFIKQLETHYWMLGAWLNDKHRIEHN